MYDPLKQYAKIEETPSFFKRSLAFLLDFAILSMTILAPVTTLLEKVAPTADFKTSYALFVENQTISTIITWTMIFVFTLIMLYFTILEYLVGQTAGKRLMNLEVVDINNQRPTLVQCILRNLVFLPVFPFIVFWIIDPLYLLFAKQTLSEQLTKTRTIIKQVKL